MSLILRTAARALVPLILLFSVYMLLRGHDHPGGGFIGGMVAGGAFALHLLAYGLEAARRAIPVSPPVLVTIGLMTSLASGVVGLVGSGAFLTGIWWTFQAPVLGTIKLSTVLFFDIGVFLLVTGMTLSILFHLAEER